MEGKELHEDEAGAAGLQHGTSLTQANMASVLSKLLSTSSAPRNEDHPVLFTKLKQKKKSIADDDAVYNSTRQKEKKDTAKQKGTDSTCGYVKPNVLDKEKERNLSRVATRGVVQLFNAVREHQRSVEGKLGEAKGSERRKEKVLTSVTTGTFLDLLKASTASINMGETEEGKLKPKLKRKKEKVRHKQRHKLAKLEVEEDEGETWDVMKDNFMMSARMKDWDKETE